MSVLKVESLWYRYPGREAFTLKGVELELKKGELVLITGPTGSGKSTLVNAVNGLIPHHSGGEVKGKVLVAGRDTKYMTPSEIGRFVGTVFQSPDDQLVSYRVEEEVRFVLENMGYRGYDVGKVTERVLKDLGLWEKRGEKIENLSGGEKQRLAIAVALSTEPEALVLDEPTSQLDQQGRDELIAYLERLKGKKSVLVVEHRVRDIEKIADRVYTMKEGRLKEGMEVETPVLKRFGKRKGKVILELKNLTYRYNGGFSIDGLNLSFRDGEVVAILGPNGSGKSTLLKLISGLLRPHSGEITLEKGLRVSMLLQNPDLMLIWDSVEEELRFSPENIGMGMESVEHIAESLDIKAFLKEHPFSLSKGQRLRVALGSILTSRPDILLLDEPTTGQDEKNVASLMELAASRSRLLIFSTHDEDMAWAVSTRIVRIKGGRVVEDTSP